MYSRDIFPRYTAGGMPIPEGYSGHAVRRTPPPTSGRGDGAPRPAERPAPSREPPQTRMSARAAEGLRRPPLSPQEPSAPPVAPEEGRQEISPPEPPAAPAVPQEPPQTQSIPHKEGGLPAILSAFLPPKPDTGGALSHIGLEEALLLGLFLLLSQSDEEEDTLMLLALLFLYR